MDGHVYKWVLSNFKNESPKDKNIIGSMLRDHDLMKPFSILIMRISTPGLNFFVNATQQHRWKIY